MAEWAFHGWMGGESRLCYVILFGYALVRCAECATDVFAVLKDRVGVYVHTSVELNISFFGGSKQEKGGEGYSFS